MKIEHFALNVAFPREMAAWYIEHLQMRVARRQNVAPFTHFLVDESGNAVLEIYNNPANEVPAYAAMNPLLLHLAFASENPSGDMARLLAAGATLVEELHLEDGSHLVMLRDPWGLAMQLCKRGVPLLNASIAVDLAAEN